MAKTTKKQSKPAWTKPLSTPAQPVQAGIERTLPIVQASAALAVSEKTVRRWAKSGCPHDKLEDQGGALLFNLAEVGHWLRANEKRGEVGRPPETDSSILEARRRKEWALASRYEFELQELRRQSAESRSLHGLRRESVSFLHGLISQIHIYDSTAATAERLEICAQTARRFLAKCWYTSPNPNESMVPLREAAASVERITGHVGLFLSGWPLRAAELVGLTEPELKARLTLWRDEILDGLNREPPPAEPISEPIPGLDEPSSLREENTHGQNT